MEAPDKIYVNYRGFGVFDEPVDIKMQASQIEYTRTDAFIEKVIKYLYDNNKSFILTEKDIEDLKKYLENT